MKRKLEILSILLFGCISLAACGNTGNNTDLSTTETPDNSSQPVEEATAASSTVMGRIEAIEDQTITLATMGHRPDGDMPADANGGPGGQKPDDDMPADADGAPGGQKPDGDMPADADGGPGGQKPDGDMPADAGGAPGGQKPDGDMPDSETVLVTVTDSTVITDESGNTISLSDLSIGSMITVSLDEAENALSISIASEMGDRGMGGAPQGQQAPDSYTSVHSYTSDAAISNENLLSEGTDENAVWVSNGADVTLDSVSVARKSADSTGGDSSSFYGIGASLLVTDGTLNLKNSSVTSDADGGAGVFAYGDGTAYISDTTINTTGNTSGGIHVAGGGTLYASDLTVDTSGESAAAIRSDRGGGTMVVESGSYTSHGLGSPAVYCTADITISDSVLTATGSEAVCIEGLNSLTLNNCDVSGAMLDQETNDCTWNVILYQSMSGDSEIGNSTFSMTGGSLTAKNGGMFYTTNTESTFYLSDVSITYADNSDFFLKCTGNENQRGWGNSGQNGADCTFTADAQNMEGAVIWDSISNLDFVMQNGSVLTGMFIQDESAAGNGGSGEANLTIDADSAWIVTGNSTLSNLTCSGKIKDIHEKTVTIIDNDGTVLVEGDSSYTITVKSYSKTSTT